MFHLLWLLLNIVTIIFGSTLVSDIPFSTEMVRPYLLTAPTLRYEAPDDCQWWTSTPNEVALTCKLRTINSEFDTTNFSVIPSDHTTFLRIECSEAIMSKSSIDDKSLMHLVRLRELIIDNCKLSTWPKGTLAGLRDLRNLTVRTKNKDWSTISLEFASESFLNVRQLERLDLSFNNIWSFPELLFCPLINMAYLNLSQNSLQDIGDMGFRDKSQNSTKCNLDIRILDASNNNFVIMPANGLNYLRRLEELYLHDNEINLISDNALASLNSLKIIDLSNNKIVALPSEVFKHTPGIKEIYLQNNSISVISTIVFSNLTQLLALDLSQNYLTTQGIHDDSFVGLIRLVLLNLSRNKITKIGLPLFRDLYTLQILNLAFNQIETIPADTFAPMSNLHTLLLSSNQIKYLDAYSLNGLYVLSLLSLDNNLIEGVHPEVFRNCSSLQDLNLNGNLLPEIPLALKNMHLLRTVDLGENRITSLEEPNFKGMTNLYGLRLIGNQIVNVSKTSFEDLPSLQILNLARNKIQKIERGTFEVLTNLQAIRLDANQITDINNLFVNVPTLLWLNISDNQIDWFDYGLLPHGLQWLDLHKNLIPELGNHYQMETEIRIQTLDASFNKLTQINAMSIPNTVELLFLNDNQISKVEPHTFLKKTNLSRVDLYANRIINMDLHALRLTPVDSLKPLPEFYIGGNPYQCDCTMEWLQRINRLDHLRQHPRVMDLDSIYCKLLYDREKSLTSLIQANSSEFLCTYKTHCFALCHCCDFDACDCEMTCPTNCTCYHDQSWSANIVDCSGAGYTQMPSRIPMDATEVYLDGNNFGELSSHAFIGRKNLKVLYANNSNIAAVYNHTFSGLRRLLKLHLEHNNIKSLLGFEFTILDNLRELYLQNNRIHYIDNRTFTTLKHLEILHLDNNRITNFYVWQFSSNPFLTQVALKNNPFSCDCHYLKKFRGWFQANYNKILDPEALSCILTNITQVVTIPLSDFNSTTCTTYTKSSTVLLEGQVSNDHIILLLITIALFLTSLGIVFGCFYYRRELRVWIYSMCGLRMCYKTTSFEEHKDKDRLFDAYISYSVKDEAFITQILAPGLEAVQPGYRLCLHYRDFNVSAYVADTIIEAVESSRRTVVVLSNNFLHNEWCRFEFKSALHEVLKDRRRRLIIILTGEIPQRDLDPDLRLYLKTNTVIEWGDRQFWQKLRFAMPDVKRPCAHQRSSINIYTSTTPPCHLDHQMHGGRSRSPALPPPPPPGKIPHHAFLQPPPDNGLPLSPPLWT